MRFGVGLAILIVTYFATSAVGAPQLLGGKSSWCSNGAATETTEECICMTHKGEFCRGSRCQEGYGMSFYHKSCADCRCDQSQEWLERKRAQSLNRPKRGKKGKVKMGKAQTDD